MLIIYHVVFLHTDPDPSLGASHLWILDDDGELKNKAVILDKKWNITTKKTAYGTVIEEDFVDGKPGQVWKQGKPDAEGYFSLEDSKSSKILTATSSSKLEVKGNRT